jgi:malonate decarboxylase epsilon subunit
MRVALLFPGQGSQRPGMFARFREEPSAQDVFAEAREVLGYDVRERDTVSALRSTVDVQTALLVDGVASARVLAATGVRADAVTGHSVGAFSAAVAANALAFQDALRIVRERAQAMQELFPSGYGLGAVVGLREPEVRRAVEEVGAAGGAVFVANVNSPLQCVIAGENRAVELALEKVRTRGAQRAERLDVAVPSHCPLLAPVQQRLERLIAQIVVRAPSAIYIGSVGPRVIRDAASLRQDLASGVAHEVRWHDATTMLAEMGAAVFIEAAPGHVLTDLARTAFPGARALALDDTGPNTFFTFSM